MVFPKMQNTVLNPCKSVGTCKKATHGFCLEEFYAFQHTFLDGFYIFFFLRILY